jgi:hypothetical protein
MAAEVEAWTPDEQLAWTVGAELARIGAPISRVLTMPRWAVRVMLAPPALAAWERMSSDSWASFVRTGYEATPKVGRKRGYQYVDGPLMLR